jgi:hypothetical protein
LERSKRAAGYLKAFVVSREAWLLSSERKRMPPSRRNATKKIPKRATMERLRGRGVSSSLSRGSNVLRSLLLAIVIVEQRSKCSKDRVAVRILISLII